jgi:hypothetical protein
MAVTQFQQYLADKAQTPMDSEECCLAMGGVVDSLNDTCTTGTQSFYLEDSCSFAANIAENTPDAVNQQSGGGLGSWLQQNAETVGTLVGTIGGLFGLGTPPPSPTGLNEPAQDDGKKTLVAVAVAILVVVVAIFLIRKTRK